MDLPSDLFWFPLPIRDLLVFLAGAYVWRKAKDTSLSLRFVLAISVGTALGTAYLLTLLEIFIEEWIEWCWHFSDGCGRVFLYLAGGYRWCPVAHLSGAESFSA